MLHHLGMQHPVHSTVAWLGWQAGRLLTAADPLRCEILEYCNCSLTVRGLWSQGQRIQESKRNNVQNCTLVVTVSNPQLAYLSPTLTSPAHFAFVPQGHRPGFRHRVVVEEGSWRLKKGAGVGGAGPPLRDETAGLDLF